MTEERAATSESVWTWRFYGEHELRAALEEYTEYILAQGAPPDNGDPDPTKKDRAWRIYAQNREIDRRMKRLEGTVPHWWRLIDSYYRQGLWGEFRGWTKTGRLIGLTIPQCPGPVRCLIPGDDRLDLPTCRVGRHCQWDRDTFEVQLSLALTALLHAGEVR